MHGHNGFAYAPTQHPHRTFQAITNLRWLGAETPPLLQRRRAASKHSSSVITGSGPGLSGGLANCATSLGSMWVRPLPLELLTSPLDRLASPGRMRAIGRSSWGEPLDQPCQGSSFPTARNGWQESFWHTEHHSSRRCCRLRRGPSARLLSLELWLASLQLWGRCRWVQSLGGMA